ncbi:MAG: CpaE family protein [Bacilli bacterium]
MASKKGKTVCVFSAKGGVGKTTNAINLAGIYKLLNKKVLIVDLDLFGGGVALALNKTPDKTIYDMAFDVMNGKYNDFKDYITVFDDSIHFIASPKDPRCASKIDTKYLDLILDRAVYLYDVVIIDTNFVLDEMNLYMLDRIDKILFIVTNDPFDVKNMKSLLTIFHELKIDKYKLLLNNSRDPFKDYFSIYDIRNILNNNIDYTLSSGLYLKDMENFVMAGKIITLEPRMSNVFSKDYNTYMTMALDLIDGGEKNE